MRISKQLLIVQPMPKFDLEEALDRAAAAPDSRRASLLRSAEYLFAERGFDGVTVRDIADAAGVNVATLHLHWKTKAVLYEAVCRQHARELMAFLSEAGAETAPEGPPLAAELARWIDAAAGLFAERPAIARLALQSVTDRAPVGIASLFSHDVSLFRQLESRLRKAMADDPPSVEPILVVLSLFYFGIVVFSDSPLQQALLGGSVCEDADVRQRVTSFAQALLARLTEAG